MRGRLPRPPLPRQAPPAIAARILLLRDDLMILDKPAGLPVHRGPRGGASLEDWLEPLRMGKRHLPQPAHRLDTDTAGCLVLGDGQELHGYALSHPWHFGQPPALDTLLGALPDVADTYYLHDVALAETVRGGGFGRQIVAKLIAAGEAARAPNLTLVAVNDSVQFWRRQGFTVLQEGWMAAKLASYGEDARFMCRPLAGE